MGSIISAIYDDIKLHGSVEAAQAWRDRDRIPYFPDLEVVITNVDHSDIVDALTYGGVKKVYYLRADDFVYYDPTCDDFITLGTSQCFSLLVNDGGGPEWWAAYIIRGM